MSQTSSAEIENQLVDPQKLGSYLAEQLGGGSAFDVSRHIAGHSNETFFVSRGAEHWILRRPPLAVYLPTAHDVLREYKVISALQSTRVRVPKTVLSCDDDSIIGAPFYLMERVEGTVLRFDIPSAIDDIESRRRISEEMIGALVELHAVDPVAVGLEGFGKPTGYLERQIRRWTGQLELATSITVQSREVQGMWDVRDWLTANLPGARDPVIVHGDYKLDNVIFKSSAPASLNAILDWEMSTIGDPLSDLGWLVSFWSEQDDPEDPLHDDLARITASDGFLGRGEMIDLYEQMSSRTVGDLRWYVVAAVWKLACLLEGSFGRHLLGTTDDPFFARLEEGVPALAARAMQIAMTGV